MLAEAEFDPVGPIVMDAIKVSEDTCGSFNESMIEGFRAIVSAIAKEQTNG